MRNFSKYEGYARPHNSESYTLDIGSIKDIADYCSIDELFNEKEIKFTIDWKYNRRSNFID
ncbi:MAG: hypothetical protein ACYCVD_19675 [Desulfitobacteriaceae bacterium]